MSHSSRLDLVTITALALSAACSSSSTPTTHPDAATDIAVDSPTDSATQPQDVAPDVQLPVDAGTDAAVPTDVTMDAGTDAGLTCTLHNALIATSNYAMGGWAIGPVATPSAIAATMGNTMDQDHDGIQSGCVMYDVERENDYVDVLDSAHLPAILHHIPLRPSSVDAGGGYYANPHDVITLAATRAYVAQASLPRVAIIDPTMDGAAAVTGLIDLTPVTTTGATLEGGSPSAVAFASYGGFVYLAMQNLDSSYAPGAPGAIAVIDPSMDSLVDTNPTMPGVQPITLTNRNPQAMVVAGAGRVALSEAGVITFSPPQVLDGLIEAVDLTTNAPVAGQTVTEMQLGGDISDLVMFDNTHGWVAVTVLGQDGGASVTSIIAFNLATSSVGALIVQTGDVCGMALGPDSNVWMLDCSTGASGVRIFMPSGTEITTHPISTGSYPPYGITFTP